MTHYYNEFAPFPAQWLRNLMNEGLIEKGTVDERSIKDLAGDDVRDYHHCHYFAGIGGWSLALRLAGWPAERPVWTGSCPCQPYSSAGKNKGDKDERNLWPDFFRLIRDCRPDTIFGEQVGPSTVVGPAAGPVENLQEVRDREAVFRVLRELERQSPVGVQRMRPGDNTTPQADESGSDHRPIQELEGRESRPRASECGEASCLEAGSVVQPESGEHPVENRRGALRTDGDSLRLIEAPRVECAVAGQDRSEEGVHDGQREGDSVFHQRDGEHVGSEQDFGDCVGDFGESPESFKQFIRQAWTDSPKTLEPVWFDGIRSDLESAGYTVRACLLGAHSVLSPHVRQRLYWVATADRTHFGMGNATSERCREARMPVTDTGSTKVPSGPIATGRLEHAARDGRDERRAQSIGRGPASGCEPCGLVDANGGRGDEENGSIEAGHGPANHWTHATVIPCGDGKSRRIERGSFPLAYGIPQQLGRFRAALRTVGLDAAGVKRARGNRVGRLAGYGNAIVPQVAAEFIAAFLEAEQETFAP